MQYFRPFHLYEFDATPLNPLSRALIVNTVQLQLLPYISGLRHYIAHVIDGWRMCTCAVKEQSNIGRQ